MVKANRKNAANLPAKEQVECTRCGDVYDDYPHSNSICWSCITREREKDMIVKPSCQNKKTGQNLCTDALCLTCYRLSFDSHDRSLCWSSDNARSSREVSKSSGIKHHFNCVCGHKFSSALNNIVNGQWCPYCCLPCRKLCDKDDCVQCFNNSFASLSQAIFWNKCRNNSTVPRHVARTANKSFWFDCKCGHAFLSQLNNIVKGQWCPYCCVPCQKLCDNEDCSMCFDNSFASSPHSRHWYFGRNNSIPRNVPRTSNKKYWFSCMCGHIFSASLKDISTGSWCPYCSKPCKKLCDDEDCNMCFNNSFASIPQSKYWSKALNINTIPRKVSRYSHKKYWFICHECKISFEMGLASVTVGQWCPNCKNKTEQKLFKFLLTLFKTYDVKREMKFDWCMNAETHRKLPFDFFLKSLMIIIELDGSQHFRQVWNWKAPEETQARDIYKMKCAAANGITVVRLLQEDVYHDKYDWKSALIPLLVKHSTPCIHLLDNGRGVYISVGYDRVLEHVTPLVASLAAIGEYLQQDFVRRHSKYLYSLIKHFSEQTNIPLETYLDLVREYSKITN